jgi:hypothetical protein
MSPDTLAQRLRSWPVPAGWPPVVQRLVNEETTEEYMPSRRRAWLLWRIVAALLSDYDLTERSTDLAIGAAVAAGEKRINGSARRAIVPNRPRRRDVCRRDIANAFIKATFGMETARSSNPLRTISG